MSARRDPLPEPLSGAGLVEVAVPLPLFGTFTYAVPGALAPLDVGCRVLVPFGRRRVTGYVLGHPDAAPDGVAPKAVVERLDEVPILPADLIALCRWAAAYYLHPLGEVIRTALPPGINVESVRRAYPTEAGGAALASDAAKGRDAEALAALVAAASAGLRVGARGGVPGAVAARLEGKGWARIESEVASARIRPRRVETVAPQVDAEGLGEALADLSSAPVQAAVLEWLVARGEVTVEELKAAFPRARDALNRLSARGLVTLRRIRADRIPGEGAGPDVLAGDGAAHAPTPAQASALEVLEAAIGGGFSPFLLQGVTGSGKTEVYLRLIEAALAAGRGALVLVPEIALTPQLAGRFRARFGARVAVLHSGLADGERHDEWWRLRRGEARVAVGVRSAVFAPVADLAVVIVDEEHEPSFKQEEGLRYQARDLALVRGREAGAVVVLGSATPSMESLLNVRAGRYGHLRLPGRVAGRPMPSVEIVDLRRDRPAGRPGAAAGGDGDDRRWLLSDPLCAALGETASAGRQAILFLNRRGHAPSLVCMDCGEPTRCPNCEVGLTLHRHPQRMLCHYCAHETPPPGDCPSCGGELSPLGAGTQSIEEEVVARLPGLRVARLDRDTTARRGALGRILADFALGRSDVLVGTQMVAKGHDFPGVTLVGVVLADTGLSVPDFRAAERTFQLLAQVSGRAGRGEDPGRVLLQSWRPEHPAVVLAARSDFDAFADAELIAREAGRWPPHCRLLMVRIAGNAAERVAQVAARVARRAEAAAIAHPEADVEVLGPAPAPLARLRGRTRWQILIKAPSTRIVAWMGDLLSELEVPPGVDLSLDVDPVGML
jgi:primosomal protein N' (replication factor Y) (superfamily II helicase)